MTPLWQQLQALRTPPNLRASQSDELDFHITQNILRFLESVSPKVLVTGDDKSISDPLEVLRPDVDTLPYLYTLTAQVDAATHNWKEKLLPKALEPGGALWLKIIAFLANFDPVEIRYAGSKWREMLGLFDRVSRYGKTIPIMVHMAHAMLRVDPSAGTFTSTHFLFVNLCLRTRSFSEARLILDRDIHSFPAKDCPEGTFLCSAHQLSNGYITLRSELTDKINLTDVLRYYLLGAMNYIGLQDWVRASHYLEHVLSTPTNNVANGLMLEAYKKWVLVGLLANGKVSQLPKTANTAAMKAVRSAAKPYDSVAEAFKLPDSAKFHAEVHEAQSLWSDDGNLGLISRVSLHHRKLFVIHMEKVYAAVPVSTLATNLGMSPSHTTVYIRNLVKQGLLNARVESSGSVNQPEIVRFLQAASSGSLAKSEEQLNYELINQTRRIKMLASHIDEADRRLSLTKEYLGLVRKSRKLEMDRNSPEQDVDMGFPPAQASDEDESVMADVG